VVYNNEEGGYGGMLAPNTSVIIPVMSISREEGLSIIDQEMEGKTTTLNVEQGYGYSSGTSMAAPHGMHCISMCIYRYCFLFGMLMLTAFICCPK